MTDLADWRRSSAAAQQTFEALIPRAADRALIAKLMGVAIRAADEVSASSWVVTLFEDCVRLNVGPVELVTVIDGAVRLLLTRQASWQPIEAVATEIGVFGQYKSIKDGRPVVIQSDRIHLVMDELRQDLPLSASISARARRRSTWTAAHSDRANTDDYESLPETERRAITLARIGQGVFRQRLLDFWNARCAVTGCANTDILYASHIKPWRDATAPERLDPCNGLLLSPTMDRCFDRGLVSFRDDGTIMISERLSTEDRRALGIKEDMRLRRVDDRQRLFLAHHRASIFSG
jgi:hypothetical protein